MRIWQLSGILVKNKCVDWLILFPRFLFDVVGDINDIQSSCIVNIVTPVGSTAIYDDSDSGCFFYGSLASQLSECMDLSFLFLWSPHIISKREANGVMLLLDIRVFCRHLHRIGRIKRRICRLQGRVLSD